MNLKLRRGLENIYKNGHSILNLHVLENMKAIKRNSQINFLYSLFKNDCGDNFPFIQAHKDKLPQDRAESVKPGPIATIFSKKDTPNRNVEM